MKVLIRKKSGNLSYAPRTNWKYLSLHNDKLDKYIKLSYLYQFYKNS